MPSQKVTHKHILMRFMPLYAAAFLQGFVLWYAIEKLFMHQIGYNDAGIGVMVAAYSALMLLVETPSGILADRWSRKGVLALAGVALALSSLVGAVSAEPATYIVCALLWGIFYALYSGTYDSIVYDTVVEETQGSAAYEHYYGRVRMLDGIALILGAFAGGLITEIAGIREAYWHTIPIALASVLAILAFREPQLHKAAPLGSVTAQIKTTFKAVLGRQKLVRILVLLVTLTLITDALYEFSQLWAIALGMPEAAYGPWFAGILASITLGGLLAGKAAAHRKISLPLASIAMLASTLVLALVPHMAAIFTAQVVLGTAGILVSILLSRDLHDNIDSRVRAGASSAVSTLSRIILIPFALLFGLLSTHYNIFAAGWLLCGLAAIVAYLELRHWQQRRL